MELTEETLALLESRIIRANLRGVMVEVQPDILDAMIAEIREARAEVERRDAENATLRTALQTIEVLMSDISDDEQLRRAVNSAANAGLLDAKPDAAPAPVENAIKVGDKVMIANGLHKGVVGIVKEIHRDKGIVERYNSGRILHIPLEQLERI